jgi:hypothetical protein
METGPRVVPPGQAYSPESTPWDETPGYNPTGEVVGEAPLDGGIYSRQNAAWLDIRNVFMRWVRFTGPPQSFLAQDMTRDGDWTMVAIRDTSDRPAPQPTGTTEDLLPAWTPATNNLRAGYTLYNEWTTNIGGWIDQHGVDVISQNLGAVHTVTLTINGVVRDKATMTPTVAGIFWANITPIVCASGVVIRETLQVTQISNNYMYWMEQAALFTTAPVYCSLAQGSKDGAAASATAYGCHLMFIPGTISPDWDIVAYGGTASGA